MVGQQLEEFLRNRGLEAEDVPKVIGACISAKYATLLAGVVIGVRYQPLRQMVLTRSRALRSVAMPSAPPVWGRGPPGAMRVRVSEVVEATTRRARLPVAKLFDVEARCLAAGRWRGARSAGQALLLQRRLAKMRDLHEKAALARRTWHAMASAKYWRLADRLESFVLRSRVVLTLSARFGFQPANLIIGAAEGAVISKMALPLTLPLTLLLALRTLSHRRAPSLADSGEETDTRDTEPVLAGLKRYDAPMGFASHSAVQSIMWC